jgi:hypothetical protein
VPPRHGGASYLRLLPVRVCTCRALVSLRLSWGPSPFAFTHLLLCSCALATKAHAASGSADEAPIANRA